MPRLRNLIVIVLLGGVLATSGAFGHVHRQRSDAASQALACTSDACPACLYLSSARPALDTPPRYPQPVVARGSRLPAANHALLGTPVYPIYFRGPPDLG